MKHFRNGASIRLIGHDIPRVLCFDCGARGQSNGMGGSTMRLEERIQALEAQMLSDPVILHFADGSVRTLTGRRDFLLDLLSGAYGGDLSTDQAAQLDLIRKCVRAQEPGGGRLVELM
jgi:hypothetical protein